MRWLFSPFLFLAFAGMGQYKNDNVLYKTVYPEDLCNALKNNPGFLLLDVRSRGESDDTSSFTNLNIGHLEGAKNISIQELANRLPELYKYREKPVFIYCSHSQRSRRASKLLIDSGFTNVFNVNGGLTTFHYLSDKVTPCESNPISLQTGYKLVSPAVLFNSDEGKQYTIIDIRNDSIFKGISEDEKRNAGGKFNNAIHIPLSKLESKISSLKKDKSLLIVDDAGNESPLAVKLLHNKGFSDVAVLFNGMEGVLQYLPEGSTASRISWTPLTAYLAITGPGFDRLMQSAAQVNVIDIRAADEFDNKAKDYWRNGGKIKDAINIPYTELETKFYKLPGSTSTPLVLYDFSGSNEVFKAARSFIRKGYNNVYVLTGGLFSMRWRAANIKGQERLKDWVVNVPEENL